MSNFIKAMTVATIAAFTLPAAVSADTILFTKTHSSLFGDPALRGIVQISGDATPTQNVYAGGFHVSTGGEGFIAFCIDLAEQLKLSVAYETADTPFLSETTRNLSRLFTGYFEDIDTGLEAAAFQVSIWELISDQDGDLATGVFQLQSNGVYDNNAVRAEAQGYLDGLSAFDAKYDLNFFLAQGTQDLMTARPSPVPLPATGLMLVAAMGALSLRARIRTKF